MNLGLGVANALRYVSPTGPLISAALSWSSVIRSKLTNFESIVQATSVSDSRLYYNNATVSVSLLTAESVIRSSFDGNSNFRSIIQAIKNTTVDSSNFDRNSDKVVYLAPKSYSDISLTVSNVNVKHNPGPFVHISTGIGSASYHISLVAITIRNSDISCATVAVLPTPVENGSAVSAYNSRFAVNTFVTGNLYTATADWSGSIRGCTLSRMTTTPVLQLTPNFTIEHSVFWDDIPGGAMISGGPVVRNSNVRNGAVTAKETNGTAGFIPGLLGNIDQDPVFVKGPRGDFYLSQIAAGQSQNSPCVDPPNANGALTATAGGVDQLTTRTDGAVDTGIMDMGYHYPP